MASSQVQRHRFRTQAEYDAYLRVANESVEVGKETLSALAGQSESLDRATTVATASQYNIDKSARVLRGMTWWGSVQNWFSDEPVAPRPHRANWTQQRRREELKRDHGGGMMSSGEAAMARSDFRTGSFASLCDDAIQAKSEGVQPVPTHYRAMGGGAEAPLQSSVSGLSARERQDRDELFLSRPREQQQQQPSRRDGAQQMSLAEVQRVQDDHLGKLSVLLDEQRRVGSTLHMALTEQNMQIEDLDARTEKLHDSTRSVIRKAARLSQGAWSDKPKFVANVAFREVKTGLYLTVRGDEVRLLEPHLCKPCKFAAYMCQSNISGFQSVLTHRWLGQTLLGDLKVRGSHLGRNESFEIEWTQGSTFLMSYSANWGNGGYIMTTGPGGSEGKVTIGGYGTKEKHEAARFVLVDCDDYSDSQLVNEVLVRQPRLPGGAGR